MHENTKGTLQGNSEEQGRADDISILAGIAASFDGSTSLQVFSPYIARRKNLIKSEEAEDWHSVLDTLSVDQRTNLSAGINLLLRKGYASVGRVRGLTFGRIIKIPFMGPKRAILIKTLFPSPEE
jgi:hypothetical protein